MDGKKATLQNVNVALIFGFINMKYKLSLYNIEIAHDENYTIIYNSVTGGIAKIENAVYELLKGMKSLDDSIPYYEILKDESYIVPFSRNEYKFLRFRELKAQMDADLTDTLTYVIAPTTACNLRCAYCFEHEQNVVDKPNEETILAIVNFIVNQCKQHTNVKHFIVTWFGGEPTLCIPEIIRIGQLLKEKLCELNIEFSSSIITNGILLDKHNVLLLKNNCNLKYAQITMDGRCGEYCKKKRCSPSEYEKLIRNICDICSDIDICIRFNAEKDNLTDLYALADYLYGNKRLVGKIKLYFAMLRDYTKGQIKGINFFTLPEYQAAKRDFYKYLRDKGYVHDAEPSIINAPSHIPIFCNLARYLNYAIGPHGELYKCEHHFGQSDKVIGDVWVGLYYNNYFFDHVGGVFDKLCEDCNLYPICQTNCPEIHSLVVRDEDKCLRYQSIYKSICEIVKCFYRNK